MKKIKSYHLLLLPAILFLAASCHQPKTVHQSQNAVKMVVKTAPVTKGNMQDTLHIYGVVKIRQEVLLASQFDGRLTNFSLLDGSRVGKGKQVGIIVPPLREALLRVMNQVPAAERKTLSEEIKEIPLISPMDGVVLKIFHRSGDVVQKGEAIVKIANLKQLDVYADLPVQYVPLVRKLKTIQMQFINYPHAPLELPVSAFAGKVNTDKQTLALRLSLPNPQENFRPGMRVKLWFPGVMHRNTLIIPRSALLEQEGLFHVFVVKNGKALKHRVTVGIRQARRVEILSGLKAGDQVVTDKAYSLTNGMEVEVR